MFTGIITDVGTIRSAEQRGDLRLQIETGFDLDSVDLGASIACSGVCLTVVDKGEDWFAVDVSAETSTANQSSPLSTTVRQTPEQAIDAPRSTVSRS